METYTQPIHPLAGPRITFSCEQCGKSASRRESEYHAAKHHFCGRICARCWQTSHSTKMTKVCPECQESFTRHRSLMINGATFCSKSCRAIHLVKKGSDSPLYIDGRPSLRHMLKSGNQYMSWRRRIYTRDGFRCVKCGTGKDLNAHHIRPFSELLGEFISLHPTIDPLKDKMTLVTLAEQYTPFWDIDNGVCLCERCHSKEHPNIHCIVKNHASS